MQFLDHKQLETLAPSVFAARPHTSVSDRYGFVPTIDIVDALAQEGWKPVVARQTCVRHASRRDVTRHMLRFRSETRLLNVGDVLVEMVLSNSHDGTCCFQLDLGIFRLVCSNGMLASMGGIGIRVRHGKNCIREVLEGSYQLIEALPRLEQSIVTFGETRLDRRKQALFCEMALKIRYGADWQKKSPIKPDQLNKARRAEDTGEDLWRVLNRVQENMLQGNLSGRSASGRRVRTRPVRSVVEDIRVNRSLWRLAERFSGPADISLEAA